MTSTYGKLLAAALAVSTFAPAFAAEVDHRQVNQQARIAGGTESGRLTPHEAARLERKDSKIHREIRRDRLANGGKLTRGERAKVNREENRTSRHIYRAKHNDRHM